MGIFACDSETFLIKPGLLTPRLVCVSTYDGTEKLLLNAKDGLDWVEARLDGDDYLIFHNGPYDLGVFAAARPRLLPKIFAHYDKNLIKDTMVREKLIAIRDVGDIKFDYTHLNKNGKPTKRKFKLDELSQKYRGIALDKDEDGWRLRFGTLVDVPISEWPTRAVLYATEDAVATYEVCALQDDGANIINEDETCKAAWALHLMSAWGIRTELGAVTALKAEVESHYNEYKTKLSQAGIFRENGSKNMSVLRGLIETAYARHGLEVPKTDKGAVQTSAEVVDDIVEKGAPELAGFSEMSGLEKMLGTFIPILELGTEFGINAEYREIVATGRTSCAKPPMQQPPRKGGFRECFVPRGPMDQMVEVPDDYVLQPGEEWA